MRTLMMTMAAFATASLAGAGTAAAREWELSAGTAVHWLGSPGIDAAASSDQLTFSDLGAAVEVLRGAPLVDQVWAELRWQAGSTSASDFGLYDAHLSLQTLDLGLRGARELYPRVRVYAHGDLGGTRGRFEIVDHGAGAGRLADVDWTLSAYAGAGVDFAVFEQGDTDPHPDFALGLRLELGYLLTGNMAFSAHPSSSGAGAPLDTRAARLGDLDADGAVLRIGLFGRW